MTRATRIDAPGAAREHPKNGDLSVAAAARDCHQKRRIGDVARCAADERVSRKDCEVIEEGVRKFVSAMEWLETVYIDGVRLEAFTTSGGIGTMCETYAGRVDNLDYKTLRYPGHAALMNFFFQELLMREDRAAVL